MKVKRNGLPEGFTTALAEMDRLNVAVGFFDSSVYPDGTPVAYIAAIQEFGYPQGGIPSRSFMRSTVTKKRNGWTEQVAGALAQATQGKVNMTDALEAIGAMAAGDMSETLTQITEPALKAATIAARERKHHKGLASDKPLVDSGVLLESITYAVSEK